MTITNLKHSIWNLIFSIMFLIVATMGFLNLLDHIVILLYLPLLIAAIWLLFSSLYKIQWLIIGNNKITVRNLFGIINTVAYVDIKKSFILNASIFSIKMMHISKPYIVLAVNKSFQKSRIDDAYNRKRNKYIIVPHNHKNEFLIKSKYKTCTGNDLVF